ncbi:MAG: BamA/TamA family outer membrane protein [Cytophagales bacterium]|nr:BamA/TamA family outer membrane protein [Cytophagales bacterium]
MYKVINTRFYIYLLIFIIIFSNCNKKFKLEKDKYLLYLQRVNGNKDIPKHELDLYNKYKPNKKVLGVRFSLYSYYFGKKYFDSSKTLQEIDKTKMTYEKLLSKYAEDSAKYVKYQSKKAKKLEKLERKLSEGNWWMRNAGTPPVFYDSAMAQNAALSMQSYMRSKGYLNALVTYKADTVLNSIFLTYTIDAGTRYIADSVSYSILDGNLNRIFNENYEKNLLKNMRYYDESILIAERERLDKLYKEYGYYDFSKDYISYALDTSGGKMRISLSIQNPENQVYHSTYSIGGIYFQIDKNNFSAAVPNDTVLLDNIYFYYNNRYYKAKYLRDKILLAQNQKYNLIKTQTSLKNLNQLDVFKFVNLNYEKMPDNKLLLRISANSTSKYQISDELGFSVTQGLPGPFCSISYATRNVFNGCETFDMSLRAGIEGVGTALNVDKVYSLFEIGASTSLSFPRMLLTSKLNRYFVNYNPKTKFVLNYNYILRPEYQRSNMRGAFMYDFVKDIYHYYSFTMSEVNYLSTPYISDQFAGYLQELQFIGNNLFRSFQTALATNISGAYTYNTYQINANKRAYYFKIYWESGGTTQNLLGTTLLNELKDRLKLNAIYIYAKLSADARAYFPTGLKSTFATRAFAGIANPYAGDGVLPYEKYFFAGGTGGIRAWGPRSIGPGSYNVLFKNPRFEQPGLVQLEINNEFRFKVLGAIAGALFVDAGNVWLLNDADKSKNFKADFITEFAVGTGYGLRLDFSFLLIRFDFGLKVYDPSQLPGNRLVINQYFEAPEHFITKSQINFAIGYPY